jgi:hypothetical protein
LLLVPEKDDESFVRANFEVSLKESMAAGFQTEAPMHQKDLEYIKRMTELREERLIRRAFLFFILPSIVLGILGCFFPAFYVILPVHETDTCLCSFYNTTSQRPHIHLKENDFGDYKLASITSFLVFNWLFLVVLLRKIYRIRHIHDETLIKRECAVIVGVWTVFSVVQYILFLINQSILCKPSNYSVVSYNNVNSVTYWTIIIRDASTFAITLYFCFVVKRSENQHQTLSNLEAADTMQLVDFDMLMMSVIPHEYFKNFLQSEKPNFLAYL